MQTETVRLGGNLPADAADGTAIVNSINVYDAQGALVPLTVTYTKSGPDTWQVTGTMPGATAGDPPVTAFDSPLVWDPVTGAFDLTEIAVPAAGLAGAGTFNGDLVVALGSAGEAMTQYAGNNSISALEQAAFVVERYALGDGRLSGHLLQRLDVRLHKVSTGVQADDCHRLR